MDEQATPGPMKRRLGRGLNALLGSQPDAAPPTDHHPDHSEIHVDLIQRNPFQPRKEFDKESLTELVQSIRQHGVLQPILVRQVGDEYQLIAGERRWLAARQAGLEAVPCRVLDLQDHQVFEVAIEENLKRKDLNVLEKAQAFQDYIQKFDSTIEELAKRLSLDRSTVSNMLRLLELAEPVKQQLRAGTITAGHARAVLSLSHDDQVALCELIQSESLSVRKTEEMVRGMASGEIIPFQKRGDGAGEGAAPKTPDAGLTNHVLSLQDQLRELLGVQVEIKTRGKEKGKVIITFNSNDEFEQILRRLRKAA